MCVHIISYILLCYIEVENRWKGIGPSNNGATTLIQWVLQIGISSPPPYMSPTNANYPTLWVHRRWSIGGKLQWIRGCAHPLHQVVEQLYFGCTYEGVHINMYIGQVTDLIPENI